MMQSSDCVTLGVVEIPLSQGQVALIDEADSERVLARSWHSTPGGRTLYARSPKQGGEKSPVLMHRIILDVPVGMVVDHIDGDGLNNVRSNLRICTHKQNIRSQRAQRRGYSRFKGVSMRGSSWFAYIQHDGETIHLGSFKDESRAARQYDRAARLLFGQFAKTNSSLGLFD